MSTIDDQVKEAILTVAKAQIAEALGTDVIGKIVTDILDHRPSSSYDRKAQPTVLESLVRDEVISITRAAVREALDGTARDVIRAAVLSKADQFVNVVVDGFAGEDWRADVTIKINGEV